MALFNLITMNIPLASSIDALRQTSDPEQLLCPGASVRLNFHFTNPVINYTLKKKSKYLAGEFLQYWATGCCSTGNHTSYIPNQVTCTKNCYKVLKPCPKKNLARSGPFRVLTKAILLSDQVVPKGL